MSSSHFQQNIPDGFLSLMGVKVGYPTVGVSNGAGDGVEEGREVYRNKVTSSNLRGMQWTPLSRRTLWHCHRKGTPGGRGSSGDPGVCRAAERERPG